MVNDAAQYELSPAYDVLPSGQSLGYQQMRVGESAADATMINAVSMCNQFSLTRAAAHEEIRNVASVVSGWREHFAALGVSRGDIELLGEHIDRPFCATSALNLRAEGSARALITPQGV